MKRLVFAVLLLVSASVEADAPFQVIYNTPQGEDEKNARLFIQEEGITQTVSKLFSDEFELRYRLSLFLGGTDRPSFDAASDEIHMPYSFVFDIADRFNRNSHSRTDVDIYTVTRDAYLHALVHETSHALFVMYDLRASGNLEQAVDALAMLLLIRYYENGGDIVINAARLFVDEGGRSPTDGSESNFWAEHGFDRQRYNQAVCLVYGSDPQRYADFRDQDAFLQIRHQECVREYQRQSGAWFRVLASFLERPPPP